jgi:hypothetical protein
MHSARREGVTSLGVAVGPNAGGQAGAKGRGVSRRT